MMAIIISVIAVVIALAILGEMSRRNEEARKHEQEILEGLEAIEYLANETANILTTVNEEIKAMKRVVEGEEYYE